VDVPADDDFAVIELREALTSLSETDQEVLTLIAWHGLTPVEAAQVLGCSTATFFVRLHRARRRLRSALSTPTAERVRES
jgi:RNA polymerase sigma-70 factor (ECF subfamily)